MTDHNASTLKSLLDNKDTKELNSCLAQSKHISFEELQLACFLNKKKCFSEKFFWESDIPIYFCFNFLNSPFKIKFLEEYFSNDCFCNEELNKKLFESDPELFKKMAKLKILYKQPSFMKSIDVISHELKYSALAVLHRELCKIQIIKDGIVKERDLINEKLLEIPFDKVLLGFTRYWEEYMQSTKTSENYDWMQIEVAVIEELNNALHVFNKNWARQNCISLLEIDSFMSHWKTIRPAHKFEPSKNIILDEACLSIDEIIERGINIQSKNLLSDLYLAGMADFKDSISCDELIPNNEYERFRKNNQKKQHEEIQLFFNELKNSNENVDIHAAMFQKNLNLYNLPEQVSFANEKFSIVKMAEILQEFSNSKWKENISIWEWTVLADTVANKFNFSKEYSEIFLKAITFILGDNFENTEHYLDTPFIKIGNHVIWIGRFMKNRDWKSIILNRLHTSPRIAENEKRLLRNIREGAVKNIVVSSKNIVDAIGSVKFHANHGESGEIDVVAWDNEYIHIIEVKSSVLSDEPIHAQVLELRIESEAVEQLEKVKRYVENDWDNFIQKLSIRLPDNYSKHKVKYMVVTDYFMGSGRLYKNEYMKLSLWELRDMLKSK